MCDPANRTLADNLMTGVSKGFEKKLQLVGVRHRRRSARLSTVRRRQYS